MGKVQKSHLSIHKAMMINVNHHCLEKKTSHVHFQEKALVQ